MIPLSQHQKEIKCNGEAWSRKPILRSIYGEFYRRIHTWIDQDIQGSIVEIGSGIGNLKSHCDSSICSDLFPNPWLDLVCDGYDLPFADGSISHLVLFDVFHHLEAPAAFLQATKRVLTDRGRIILFEPFMSVLSYFVYGLAHHEPIAMRRKISSETSPPKSQDYYAAQGNATRIFFKELEKWPLPEWDKLHVEAFSTWSYFLSGGYSKPALYPTNLLPVIARLDQFVTQWPRIFGGRCLIVLELKQV